MPINQFSNLMIQIISPSLPVPITTKVVSSNPIHGEVYFTTLCDKVCQWLTTGRWFSPGTPVYSYNKTDCHNITEILLKVVLNNIIQSTDLLYLGDTEYIPHHLHQWKSIEYIWYL